MTTSSYSSCIYDDGSKFSLEGRVLKLNSAADVSEYVAALDGVLKADSGGGVAEVVLSGNTFGVEACVALGQALKRHTGIRVANLSDMFTGRLKSEIPQCLDALVDALVDKSSLRVVDLSDNAFGPAGALPLQRLLTHNRNITTLRLNNNGLGIGGGQMVADALIQAAKLNQEAGTLSNLDHVVIGRNRLESQGASYLAAAFAQHKNITRLCMPQNSIRPEGVATLLAALHNHKIQVLDLQDNTFTLQGSLACVDALKAWQQQQSLLELNIGECLLGAAGSIHILRALAGTHSKLTRLLLSYNEMNEEGALLVPAAIAGKSALMKLELNGNTFDAEGRACAAIQDALAKMDKGEGVLDELDDMEEPTDDEEEEEEEEEEVEEEEDDEKDTKKSTTTTTTTTTTSSAADDLADLMTSKLNV